MNLLYIPMGALAMAAKLHKLTNTEKQWRHSLGWPVRTQSGQSSQRAESRDFEVSTPHLTDCHPPSSVVPVPSLSLSYLPSCLSLSFSIVKSFSLASGVIIPLLTHEFLVQQLPSKRKEDYTVRHVFAIEIPVINNSIPAAKCLYLDCAMMQSPYLQVSLLTCFNLLVLIPSFNR